VDKIITKENWKTRWSKIKTFVHNNQAAIRQQLATHGMRNMDAYFNDEKNQVFNLILALYAGEDVQEVFEDLDGVYKRYPSELEFYIPQLCTYLFHFNQDEIAATTEQS